MAKRFCLTKLVLAHIIAWLSIAPKKDDGKRVQIMDIYFNGVGMVEPMTPNGGGIANTHESKEFKNGVT